MNDVPQEENRGIQEKMKAEEPDLTFSREDFLLGDLHHNRPLHLSGYIGEFKLRQVQVDPGSAINSPKNGKEEAPHSWLLSFIII